MDRARLGPGAEFDLIRRFLPDARHPGRPDLLVGPGDDAAVVAGGAIALSTDLSVEGTHFRREWLSPYEIGYRAATAALSDLAAVAARPIGVLASLAVPEADAGEFAVGVMDGVRAAAARVGGTLLGGDLTRSPGPVVVDVTVVGDASAPVLRTGAEPGDEVWVTGALGAAALAVARLLRGEPPPPEAMERFLRPQARVEEALWLAARGIPKAMLDLSDGLAGDAAHLAAASQVALVLEPDTIPVHPTVRAAAADEGEAFVHATSGGEDYEICFCARPGAVAAAAFEEAHRVPLTRVGVVEEGEGVHWRTPDGARAAVGRGGYQHFGGVR